MIAPIGLRVALIVACAAALAGCVSLLPKAKPAQLYRLASADAAEASAARASGPTYGLVRVRGSFDRAASGDRILTVAGDQVAFVAEARWVAPATVLFDEAVSRAFDLNVGPARLANREAGRFDYLLRLDVRDFAAIYENGRDAAPTVVVRLRAYLIRNRDRALVGDQVFEARVKTYDNRVSAIAAGFSEAVRQVLSKLVAWTNENGAAT